MFYNYMYYHSSHVLLSILLTFCPVTHLLFASLELFGDPWCCQLSVIHPVSMTRPTRKKSNNLVRMFTHVSVPFLPAPTKSVASETCFMFPTSQ